MDGSHLNFESLQLFLSHHSISASSKVSHIKETLQKAENQQILSSKALFGPLGVRATRSNDSDIYTSRSKNQTPCLPSTTLSTSLSPGSIIIDSLTDEDLEKRNSVPDLQVKMPNTARVASTLTPNKGHVLRKSHFARRHTQCTNSPSTKTDPGNCRKDSFLSTYSQRSCHTRYGSNKSKIYAEKEEDNSILEESESFLMIKPLSVSENNNDPGSPIFERKKLSLGLDEDVFPESIRSYANSLYTTSFSSNMRDLILNTNKDRNKNVEFYAPRPKHEALFSVVFKDKARNTFERLLLELSLKLKEESVSFRQKYQGDIEFLEVKMLKAIRAPTPSVKFEEKELRIMSEKVGVLMNEKCLIESYTNLRLLSNYLQSLLNKFDASIMAQSKTSETLVVPEYITLPKLLEKAITSHEDFTFYRDIVIYTYDLYISSQNLLLYFICRYFVPTPFNMSRSEKNLFQTNISNKTKSLILSVIIFWLQEREGDFLKTPSLLTILSSFLEVIQTSEKDTELNRQFQELWKLHEKATRKVIRKESKAQASIVLEEESSSVGSLGCINLKPCSSVAIDSQNTKRKQQRTPKQRLFSFSNKTSPKVPYTVEKLLDEPVEMIAEQLSLLDWKQFSDIELREVLNKRWTKPEKKECPNYWKHVDRFNSFSFWVQYVILSQGTLKQRMDIAEKFLKIAMICIKTHQNYCSSNYIFSALFSLSNFEVVSFEDELKKDYEELKNIFAPNGGYIKLYNDLFRDLKPPAIPNLNVFLRIFLKLQDGVNFWVSLPDSRLKYLKFQSLVQIHDYCKEMKKFQKMNFREISKKGNLYSFLKAGFTEMIPVDVVNSDEMMKKITQMIGPVKRNQPKLLKFFGIINN